MLLEMAAPDREPDRDRRTGTRTARPLWTWTRPGPGAGPEDRAGPRERREHGPAPDLAGLDRQRGRRTTPDPPGLLRLERDTDPPGLHKPDPDPRPDRGPLLVALRRRLKTASQDAHAGPAKEPDPDPARRAEGGFMRAV